MQWFDGNIDEVRVWNVARTLAEIKQTRVAYVYNNPNLTVYYTFDQGGNGGENGLVNRLTDLSNNQNNGLLNEFALSSDVSGSNWTGGYAGTVYADTDNDGYGDPNSSVVTTTACFLSGYVSDNTDCDDNNPGIHTGCVVIPAAALNFNAPPAQFVDITNTNVGKFRKHRFHY